MTYSSNTRNPHLCLQQGHWSLLSLHAGRVRGSYSRGGLGLPQQRDVGVEDVRLHVLLPLLEPGDQRWADSPVEVVDHLVPAAKYYHRY